MHDLALDHLCFSMPFWRKEKGFQVITSNFPNPARPESLLLLGCGGGVIRNVVVLLCVLILRWLGSVL